MIRKQLYYVAQMMKEKKNERTYQETPAHIDHAPRHRQLHKVDHVHQESSGKSIYLSSQKKSLLDLQNILEVLNGS